MMKGGNIYIGEYDINSINIDSNRRLSLYGLMGILQDVASLHAYELGFGYEDMKSHGVFWVLMAQKIKIDKWPVWHQKLEVKSWTTPVKGFYAFREFQLFIDNQLIGECSTKWIILNSKTRRPIRAEYINDIVKSREDYRLNFDTEKIELSDEMEFVKEFSVYNSDLDMNKHLNNTKYCKWVLNSLPEEIFKNSVVKEFDINFLSETFLGDKVGIYLNQVLDSNGLKEVLVKGERVSDKRVTFSSRLRL